MKLYWALMNNSCLNMRNNKRWSHRIVLINSLKLTRSEIICYSRHPLGRKRGFQWKRRLYGFVQGSEEQLLPVKSKTFCLKSGLKCKCVLVQFLNLFRVKTSSSKKLVGGQRRTPFLTSIPNMSVLLLFCGQPHVSNQTIKIHEDQNSLPDKQVMPKYCVLIPFDNYFFYF